MNKRITLFALLLLVSGITVKAQTLQRDSLAGVWLCIEATIAANITIPKEELEAVKVLQKGIINSKFHFKTNGLFEWQLPKDAPPVLKGMSFLNGQKWFVDGERRMVHIGQPKENLMQILVRQQDGIVYFILSDTPLLLHVRKE